MKLKKLSAATGLLSILCILLHAGYSVWAYLTFYYNPILTTAFALPFLAVACLHGVLGMLTLFLQNDGGVPALYPRQNCRTILQRVCAALIFPLLILHIRTFSAMQASAENGRVPLILLLILAELLFFAAVTTHAAVSLTNGLITLGVLSSRETQKTIDRIVYVLGGLGFAIAVYAVVRVQIVMFLLK